MGGGEVEDCRRRRCYGWVSVWVVVIGIMDPETVISSDAIDACVACGEMTDRPIAERKSESLRGRQQ